MKQILCAYQICITNRLAVYYDGLIVLMCQKHLTHSPTIFVYLSKGKISTGSSTLTVFLKSKPIFFEILNTFQLDSLLEYLYLQSTHIVKESCVCINFTFHSSILQRKISELEVGTIYTGVPKRDNQRSHFTVSVIHILFLQCNN